MSRQRNMSASVYLFHIAAVLKADLKQSIQIDNSKNQNRICKKLIYVYGCQCV